MSASLIMSRAQIAEITRYARAAVPLEACGFLVGRARDDSHVVELVHAARNLRREQGRFELDPLDHVAIDRAAGSQGLAIIATWHSHVGGAARPSVLDVAGASTDWSHVIVALGAQRDEVRAWRHVEGELREQHISLLDENASSADRSTLLASRPLRN